MHRISSLPLLLQIVILACAPRTERAPPPVPSSVAAEPTDGAISDDALRVARPSESGHLAIPPAQLDAGIEHLRFAVPVGDAPVWGPANAPVTVIMFSDFECPFCRQGYATFERLREAFGDRLRFVYKAFPLSFHPNALTAALIGESARQQGKFWEYHHRLFRASSLEPTELLAAARDVALDVDALGRDLESFKHAPRVLRDLRLAKRLDIRSTPVFFINGRRVHGAQDYDLFRRVVAEELSLVEALLRNKSIDAADVYRGLTRFAYHEVQYPGQEDALDENKVYPVPLGTAPRLGPDDAPVTIVWFGDFQCHFCARAAELLQALKARYGAQLRIVYRHLPLPFHSEALGAARGAAFAADKGKFWPFYEQLYARNSRFTRDDLRLIAMRLELDAEAFDDALTGSRFDAVIRGDLELARALGIDGTPAFFINGRPLSGLRAEIEFHMIIAEELERAAAKRAEGVAPTQIYQALTGAPKAE